MDRKVRTMDYAELSAKMREIAERDDLGKMVGKNRVIEDEAGLFEAARKELGMTPCRENDG